jgi:hypothetical protein
MSDCIECHGTSWIIVEVKGISAARPCLCRRSPTNQSATTPLTEEGAATAVKMLCDTLAFSPASDLGRVLITSALLRMCHTLEDTLWVVERACNLYTRWDACGIPGLRQILSSRCVPRDGVSISRTAAYPEGIPTESRKPKQEPLGLLPTGSAVPSSESVHIPGPDKSVTIGTERIDPRIALSSSVTPQVRLTARHGRRRP